MFRPNYSSRAVFCVSIRGCLSGLYVCRPMIVRMLGEKEREGEREWGKW